jgi:hypothetical protein
METMDYNLEIAKMKEEIKSYMQTEIQPTLKVRKSVNCIDNENSVTFHYYGRHYDVKQFFTYQFSRGKQGVKITAKFVFHNNVLYIEENKLNNIFITLNKAVKKYMLSQLYDK